MSKFEDGLPVPTYSKRQQKEITYLENELEKHMAKRKPRRYKHSLSVARTAEGLALIYDVDPFSARVAGILHDWHKVYSAHKQVQLAKRYNIDLGVDIELVQNLLHGMLTAHELPNKFPELDADVWQAISRHTTGAQDMSDLDMVLFVADGIEPLRKASPAIKALRDHVGISTLSDLYRESFVGGMVYVLETNRYLYPGTLDIYNHMMLEKG